MDINETSVPESVGLQATLIASWVQVAYRAADNKGLDAKQLFIDADIDIQLLYSPESRIASHKVKMVWDSAAKACSDETFGLSAADAAYPGMYHSLSMMLVACPTLRQMVEKLMRYRRIVDTLSVNTLEEVDSDLKFTWSPVINYESQIGAQAWIACFFRLCQWANGHNNFTKKVTLQGAELQSADNYRTFFNAPVEFDAEENALYFSHDYLDRPLLSANSAVAAKNEQLTADYLTRVLRGDTVNSVYSFLLSNMEKRLFSIDLVAEQMNLAPRTLQRKLKLSGTSYDTLLDDIRRERALQLIRNSPTSIQKVSHILGFSNISNFGRAFRRWTTISPSEYRQTMR